MENALSASLEDYLEAIYNLIEAEGAARGKDIAKVLGVKSPSVTGALRLLAEKGLIHYAPYDVIALTPEGRAAAEAVAGRHAALKAFLTDVLLVDDATAERNACRIEHVIDAPVLERLAGFVDFVRRCPRGGHQWVSLHAHGCERGEDRFACETCIGQCVAAIQAPDRGQRRAAPMPAPPAEAE